MSADKAGDEGRQGRRDSRRHSTRPSRPTPSEAPLQLTKTQLDRIRHRLSEGAAAGAAALVGSGGIDLQTQLPEAGICTLADFPQGAVHGDAEFLAAAIRPIRAPLPGSALLAFDPEQARSLIAALAGDVSRFRETAGALLAGAIEALGELASSPVEYAETSLADDSLIGLILATHAPPDAVVLSARVVLRLADRRIEGFLYLLLDAKPLEALVGRLDSSPARSSAPPSC